MKTLTILGAIAGSIMFAGAALAAPAPSGSYQQSCDDIYADWTTLSATCRTSYGGQNYSTLRDYRSCEGDIANLNGRLQCVDDSGDNNNDDDDDDDQWLPRGSYRDTCRNEDVKGGTLTADCRDVNGRYRYTELNAFRSCKGDIYNRNGMLGCRRDDHGDDDDDNDDGGYNLPGGNWRYSCRSHRIYGSILYAECRDSFGAWRQTSLDLRQCSRDVSNFGGRLVCQGGGGYGRITLYKHTNYAGKARSFSGNVADLNPYAFGNQASSVTIEGGGMWELCDKPNYKGHCVVVSRNQPNLWVFGFNDRTESVRRLR